MVRHICNHSFMNFVQRRVFIKKYYILGLGPAPWVGVNLISSLKTEWHPVPQNVVSGPKSEWFHPYGTNSNFESRVEVLNKLTESCTVFGIMPIDTPLLCFILGGKVCTFSVQHRNSTSWIITTSLFQYFLSVKMCCSMCQFSSGNAHRSCIFSVWVVSGIYIYYSLQISGLPYQFTTSSDLSVCLSVWT